MDTFSYFYIFLFSLIYFIYYKMADGIVYIYKHNAELDYKWNDWLLIKSHNGYMLFLFLCVSLLINKIRLLLNQYLGIKTINVILWLRKH